MAYGIQRQSSPCMKLKCALAAGVLSLLLTDVQGSDALGDQEEAQHDSGLGAKVQQAAQDTWASVLTSVSTAWHSTGEALSSARTSVTGGSGMSSSNCNAEGEELSGSESPLDAKVNSIILTASSAAAAADGLAAQIPFLGQSVTAVIQAAMISVIGSTFGCRLDLGNCLALLSLFASDYARGTVTREVLGFIPVAGNIAKATVAFGTTQSIGHIAARMLKCPKNADALLQQAAAEGGGGSTDGSGLSERALELFETLTEFLKSAGGSLRDQEIWTKLREMVAPRSEEPLHTQLLSNAHNLSEVSEILRRQSEDERAIPTHEAERCLEALLEAVVQQAGHPEYCDCLLLVLRTLGAQRGWPTLRSLQSLDRVRRLGARTSLADSQEGSSSGSCMETLREEMLAGLSAPSLPAHVQQRPSSSTCSLPVTQGLDRLRANLVGQDCALDRLEPFVKLKLRGMQDSEKPLVLLLTGPSGVGKTLLSRYLAEVLLGKPAAELEAVGRFKTFDMNVFSSKEDQKTMFGTPKGIAGGSGELVEVLKAWPDAVILLDEVEKADESFGTAFLKVFGERGSVFDPKSGVSYSTTKATFILTSNLARGFIQRQSKRSDAADIDCRQYEELQREVMTSLKERFIDGQRNLFHIPELRGRLTAVLPFLPFNNDSVVPAVQKLIADEAAVYSSSPAFGKIELAWEAEVVQYLANEYLQRRDEGLRGAHRLLQSQVRELIAVGLEFNVLTRGCTAVLRVASGRLDMYAVANHQQLGEEESQQVEAGSVEADHHSDPGEHATSVQWLHSSVKLFGSSLMGKVLGHPEQQDENSEGSSLLQNEVFRREEAELEWTLLRVPPEWETQWLALWQQLLDFLFEWRWIWGVVGAALMVALLVSAVGQTAVAAAWLPRVALLAQTILGAASSVASFAVSLAGATLAPAVVPLLLAWWLGIPWRLLFAVAGLLFACSSWSLLRRISWCCRCCRRCSESASQKRCKEFLEPPTMTSKVRSRPELVDDGDADAWSIVDGDDVTDAGRESVECKDAHREPDEQA
eukprot:CAMPEP_0178378816 /NCGR_PEP_ID=MMETSP0689_2-20121128/4620_1 /TAXON_ID=160604 /ORGANISM="Amphidinium massartii, Strain CS-259" /LENGTH=1037 /DNA_ID=CAMNT_0019998895 /DNA_START=48 /DNA_END=3158 /DNA_ORIENTATION=+